MNQRLHTEGLCVWIQRRTSGEAEVWKAASNLAVRAAETELLPCEWQLWYAQDLSDDVSGLTTSNLPVHKEKKKKTPETQ